MSGRGKYLFEKEDIRSPQINQEKKEVKLTAYVECKHEVAGKFKESYEIAEIEFYSRSDVISSISNLKPKLCFKYLLKNLKLIKIEDPIIFDNEVTATFSYDELESVSIPLFVPDDYSI